WLLPPGSPTGLRSSAAGRRLPASGLPTRPTADAIPGGAASQGGEESRLLLHLHCHPLLLLGVRRDV
ncbi:hypothetical protein N656DRAFT_841422, partial [Canariomyces notabilis]